MRYTLTEIEKKRVNIARYIVRAIRSAYIMWSVTVQLMRFSETKEREKDR